MKSVTIRTTFDNICLIIPEYSQLVVSRNDANLLVTGAKAYYRGGGWWRISGYSQDGRDVDKIVDTIIEKQHTDMVNRCKKALSMQNAVAQRALNYIGDTDCSFIAKGARMLQFNIVAKSHPRYKSTIAYKHGFNN